MRWSWSNNRAALRRETRRARPGVESLEGRQLLNAAQLSDRITNNHARLIDLETYQINGANRFAAIMVSNTGNDAKAWWYYFNVGPSFVSQKIRDNNARLVDIDHQANGNFSVVM